MKALVIRPRVFGSAVTAYTSGMADVLGAIIKGSLHLPKRTGWLRPTLRLLVVGHISSMMQVTIIRANSGLITEPEFDARFARHVHALSKYRGQQRIHRSPGFGLRRFARWFFAPKTVSAILEPVLSDMQVEFIEALAAKRPAKARWVQIRGYWTFWQHVALQIPVSITHLLVSLWKSM
jgi:hypothetical protein